MIAPRQPRMSPPSERGRRSVRGAVGKAVGWTARWSLRLLWWVPAAALLWTGRPWEFDLLAHFAPHLAALGALLAAPLVRWRRTRRLGIEGSVAALLCWALIVRANTINWPLRAPGGPSRPLRIVTHNADAWTSSRDFPFYAWLKAQDADVVVIVDPPPNIDGEANWLLDAYPHRHAPEPGYQWAIKIYSRFPMAITPLTTPSPATTFSFAAHRARTVTTPDGTEFLLSAMHPVSPRKRASVDRAVEAVALDGTLMRQWAEATGKPALLAGDFNSTPTGRVFRALARASGMRTYASILSRGTWPRWAPSWLAVPIDRVWATPGVVFERVEVGPAFQSGHRPVVVDLRLPSAATASASPSGPGR